MKTLMAAVFIAMYCGAAAGADDVFGGWGIFPGPNPEAIDLLPDADPGAVFRIGQVLFEYPFDRMPEGHQPVKNLSQLQSVADAVTVATPGPLLVALACQQLTVPHRFQFTSATVLDYGDAGFIWRVTYELFPEESGSTGVPYRYLSVVDGHGNLVLPRRSVFDAFFHSHTEGWTCSVLQLPASPSVKEVVIAPAEIRSRATEALLNAKSHSDAAGTVARRMVYHGQKVVRIPVASGATGELIHVEVWAVNFRDPAKKGRPDELFTVWVAPDGRTAEIRHLDHAWETDEPPHAQGGPVGPEKNQKTSPPRH